MAKSNSREAGREEVDQASKDSMGAVNKVKDYASRTRTSSRRMRKALFSRSGLKGTAVEVAWLATHVAIYPLGLVEERAREEVERHNLDGLDPVKRGLIVGDVEAAGTPIIMVHGIIDNHSIFTVLRRGLAKRGFGRMITLNYSPLTDDVRRVARRLKNVVDTVCRETGYDRVHIIGHSMGGVVSRYYIQHLGGDSRVHTLVTLGSPHHGTIWAKAMPESVSITSQMRPNSDLVQELEQPAPGCRTRMIAIWSDLDQIIIPQRNARIVHPDINARNVFIKGVGHMSLPVDGRVVHQICTTLAHLDTDGSTLADGATDISSKNGRQETSRSRSRAAASASNHPAGAGTA